jgi:hypothetical protein
MIFGRNGQLQNATLVLLRAQLGRKHSKEVNVAQLFRQDRVNGLTLPGRQAGDAGNRGVEMFGDGLRRHGLTGGPLNLGG